MINKKALHHFWTKIRPIRVLYLLVLTTICGIFCIVALRANNEEMGRLRSAVYSADQNNGNVVLALQQLQKFTTSHMNTDLAGGANGVYPPIQLKYTYQRLEDAAIQQATSANSQLYTEAQHYCEQQNSVDFSGHNRVPCIEQYVTSHSSVTLPQVPDGMYKFAFAPPTWSPDRAGYLLIFTIFLAFLTVARFILGWVLKALTK